MIATKFFVSNCAPRGLKGHQHTTFSPFISTADAQRVFAKRVTDDPLPRITVANSVLPGTTRRELVSNRPIPFYLLLYSLGGCLASLVAEARGGSARWAA
jgi:hypothetical protein